MKKKILKILCIEFGPTDKNAIENIDTNQHS